VQSVRKALIRHLISKLPAETPNYQALIRNQSIRFRSLPLAAPAPLASGTKQSTKEEESDSEEESENRSRKRARMWRENEIGEDGDEPATAGTAKGTSKFLTAAQKRKVAFINKEVNEKATSCNAYIVWTTKDASQATSQQLAALIIKHANNTVFEGQTLRVDRLRTSALSAASEVDPAVETQKKKLLAAEKKEKLDEDKRTLYLGSLDFEEKEQAVRDLCEKLMQEARGQPPAGTGGSSSTWVERVRVVKDQETGQGKGFAYVLFKVSRLSCINSLQCRD
jgi:nucleolar protein 12